MAHGLTDATQDGELVKILEFDSSTDNFDIEGKSPKKSLRVKKP